MKRRFKINQKVRVSRAYGPTLGGKVGTVVAYSKSKRYRFALVGFRVVACSMHSGHSMASRPVPEKYRGKCWYFLESDLKAIVKKGA